MASTTDGDTIRATKGSEIFAFEPDDNDKVIYNIGGEGVECPSEIMPEKSQLQKAFQEISDEALKSRISVF